MLYYFIIWKKRENKQNKIASMENKTATTTITKTNSYDKQLECKIKRFMKYRFGVPFLLIFWVGKNFSIRNAQPPKMPNKRKRNEGANMISITDIETVLLHLLYIQTNILKFNDRTLADHCWSLMLSRQTKKKKKTKFTSKQKLNND